jgi:hypothetical protein
MYDTSRPLLIQLERYVDEALYSFLVRLARANMYRPPALLLSYIQRVLRTEGVRDSIWRPTHPRTHELLATLTRSDVPEILASLPPSYVAVRSTENVVFCPYCLREAHYYRVHWMSTMSTICLIHQCWLIDRCIGCQKEIAINALMAGQCPECAMYFANTPTLVLEESPMSVQTQHLIHGWMGHQSFVNADHRFPVDCPQMLYEVASHVQHVIGKITATRIGQGWWYLDGMTRGQYDIQRLGLGVSPHLYATNDAIATSVNILMNWPEEFHRFLTALTLLAWDAEWSSRDDTQVARLFDRLRDVVFSYPWMGKAYRAYFTQHNTRSLLLQGLLRHRVTDDFRIASAAIPAKCATTLLDVSASTFDEILQRGVLRTWLGPPHPCVVFDDVCALMTRLRIPVSWSLLMILFDLSTEEMHGLVVSGALPRMRLPQQSIHLFHYVTIWSVLLWLDICEAEYRATTGASSHLDEVFGRRLMSPYLYEVKGINTIPPHLRAVMCSIGANVQILRERVIERLIQQDL